MKKKFVSSTLSLMAIALLTGCGGGGGSSSATNDNSNNNSSSSGTTDVTVVDGYIKNATVTDNLGHIATFIGNGVYRFNTSITYPITVTGGQYADTNESFDINMTAYSGSVINPLTTLIGNGNNDILTALSSASGLSADINAYSLDYAETNNTDIAKIAQYSYNIIKNGLINDFKTDIKNNSISNLADFENVLTTTINTHLSGIKKDLALNFQNTVHNLNGNVADFELLLKNNKRSYSKTGDYDDADGDGIPNWIETKLGYNPANSLDINGSADTDGDGIPDYNEIYYAEALGDIDGMRYKGFDDFNVSNPTYLPVNWEINKTSNGTILQIKSDYAETNSLTKYQVADELFFGNYAEAQDFCSNLTVGGYTDWRIPTENESLDIFRSSNYYSFLNVKMLARKIDKLQRTDWAGYYDIWTSTEKSDDPEAMELNAVLRNSYGKTVYGETRGVVTYSDTKKTRSFNTICIRTR
jgi:hypothetical protein